MGHAPEGSIKIDSNKGACQEDIFYQYKLAIHRAYAEDAVAWENEARVKAGKPIYSPEEYAERVDWHLRRIPYKLVNARYHSFQRYFHWLKQLGWVEFTGQEEPSTPQSYMPDYPQAPPRKYYRPPGKASRPPTTSGQTPSSPFTLSEVWSTSPRKGKAAGTSRKAQPSAA